MGLLSKSKKVLKKVLSETTPRQELDATVAKSKNKGGDAVPKPKGRKPPVRANSVRDLPPEEALKIAKTEEHIIPKPGGGFVGAPENARTYADIGDIRKRFDDDVAAGAQGSDWYERTQDWIKDVAGPDPQRQSDTARNLALFSSQAEPNTNLGFSIKAHNAAATGNPLDKVRTGQQARTFNEAAGYRPDADNPDDIKAWKKGKKSLPYSGDMSEPTRIKLGKKTDIFARHMDPTESNPATGTNDIWHGRAMGYTKKGKPWDEGFDPNQHDWLDKETVLAVDRANQSGAGGRNDWTSGEVQAAPWVFRKAKGYEQRFGWSPEKALEEASKSYPEVDRGFTAFDQAEDTPGVGTGHRPDIAEGSQAERRKYFDDPASGWQDEGGRDILHDAQGSLSKPSVENTGVFNQTDINPGRTTPVMTSPESGSNRDFDAGSAEMMRGPTAMKGYVDVQNMGGNSALFSPKNAKDRNAFDLFGLPDDPGEDILRGRMDELTDIIHYGGGRGALTSFGEQGPGIGDMGKPKNARAVDAHIKSQFGEQAGARPAHFTSAPTFYEEAWQKKLPGADKPGGTGAATEVLFEQLSERQIDKFDTPEFRAKVQAKFERDQASGAPIREDVQNARFLLMKGGPRALKEAMIKGAVTVAAGMGAMLPFTTAGLPSEAEDEDHAIRR